jgi:hypothetical protein
VNLVLNSRASRPRSGRRDSSMDSSGSNNFAL